MESPSRERDCLIRLARGDAQALGPLYDLHANAVYHFLLARGLEEAAAQDALQETFLAFARRGRKLLQVGNVQAYLLGTARHLSSEQQRRVDADPADPEIDPPPPVTWEERWGARNALRRLPREQAQVVVLKIWHDLTFAEIAELLELSPNTVASRYRYALAKLREGWDHSHG